MGFACLFWCFLGYFHTEMWASPLYLSSLGVRSVERPFLRVMAWVVRLSGSCPGLFWGYLGAYFGLFWGVFGSDT